MRAIIIFQPPEWYGDSESNLLRPRIFFGDFSSRNWYGMVGKLRVVASTRAERSQQTHGVLTGGERGRESKERAREERGREEREGEIREREVRGVMHARSTASASRIVSADPRTDGPAQSMRGRYRYSSAAHNVGFRCKADGGMRCATAACASRTRRAWG